MKSRFCLIALAMAAFPDAALAQLTKPEQRMVSAVDAELPRSIDLLERLVNQNSGTRNLGGVARIGAMMTAELKALGFTVEWKPMAATGRAGHLLARRTGKRGTKRILLIAHLDTVFEAASPFQRFERNGDFASGPGVGDDKGGMIVMLLALRAMQAAGTLDGANVEIVLTGDEEAVGEPLDVARADLVAAGKRADVALDFEGLIVLDGRDMGSIARRSSMSYVIRTSGRSAHSSGIFGKDVGDGAIFEMARIIQAFRTELPEPNLTFNIGLVAGGATAGLSADEASAEATGKTNVIPASAVAIGDFRALTEAQIERVRARMIAIVARHAPNTGAEIVFKGGYPPMSPTAGNSALLARLNQVNRDLGLAAMAELDPLKRGAGDISFVAADVDGLAGLGTGNSGDHTPRETVDLRSIPRQAKRAALLIARLSREASGKAP